MKKFNWSRRESNSVVAIVCITIGWMFWSAGNARGQTPSANLSPVVQEVVKLAQAQMNDDVILAYVKNTGISVTLTADDMLYLKSQGVSQNVILALQQTKTTSAVPTANPVPNPMPQPTPMPAPAPQPSSVAQAVPYGPPPAAPYTPPPPQAPPAPEINFNYFHEQLTPFGTWVNVGGVMYWHPDQAIAANPDWRPYYDMGKWVQTDNGLFWQSDYTWGDIPFHYGRWVRHPEMGWIWAPGYEWGPAWVFWRHAEVDAGIGWAPLPVGAVFVNGAFMFNGVVVGADFDFGLGEACFTFVGYDHFHEGFFRMRGREWYGHIHGDRFHDFYRRSVVRNEFHRDEHGRFVNNGIGRDRIERATHGRVEQSRFEERRPLGDREKENARRAEPHGPSGSHPAAPVSKTFRPPTETPKSGTGTKSGGGGGEKSKNSKS